jgi:hypothetical protein
MHTKVKTTYSIEGAFGSTETRTLYCHHVGSSDSVKFIDEEGCFKQMYFCEWESGNDLWDAMQRLYFPFKGEWGGELKDGVEYYSKGPWEENEGEPVCRNVFVLNESERENAMVKHPTLASASAISPTEYEKGFALGWRSCWDWMVGKIK